MCDEPQQLARLFVALDGDVTGAKLDDRLFGIAVVRVEDRFEEDGRGPVEGNDVAVGHTDLDAAAPAGRDLIAGKDRHVDSRIDFPAILGLANDGSTIVIRDVRMAAVPRVQRKSDDRCEKKEKECGLAH